MNEKGSVLTVWLLAFIPLILLGMIIITEHARVTYNYDLDLQQAVTDAVRSATLMVDEYSQANNDPKINPDAAYNAFRYALSKNLNVGIDNDYGLTTPEPTSSLKNMPVFTLIVFNGENEYGLPKVVKYPGGQLLDMAGESQSFAIKGTDIDFGSEGDRVVELNRPGCIAVIQGTTKPIISGENTGVRWACAKIVTH